MEERRNLNGLAEQDRFYVEFNDFVTIRRRAGTGVGPRDSGIVLCCRILNQTKLRCV